MNNFILIKSENNNRYLFSFFLNQIIPISPILFSIIEEYKKNKRISDCNFLFQIKQKYGEKVNEQLLDRGIKDFLFVKNSGFLKDISFVKFGRIKASTIKNIISSRFELIIETSQECNIDCKYCCYGELYNAFPRRDRKKIKFEAVRKMIDFGIDMINSNYNQSPQRKLCIAFYGGEPLLRFDLIKDVVAYIKGREHDCDIIKYTMTTNGILLKKHCDFLVENDFVIYVSLDGNKKNNSYRVTKSGASTFDKIYSALKFIQQTYPAYFKKNVFFGSVLHNQNSVEEIQTFFKKEFSKNSFISELATEWLNPLKKEYFLKMFKSYHKSVKDVKEKKSEFLQDVFFENPLFSIINNLSNQINKGYFKDYADLSSDNDDTKLFLPTGTCPPFSKGIYLSAEGYILPCERVNHKFKLGKVTEEKIDLDFQKIAKIYNNYFAKITKKYCDVCFAKNSCTECMFNIEEIDEEQFCCNGFMSIVQYTKEITQLINYMEEHPTTYFDITSKNAGIYD